MTQRLTYIYRVKYMNSLIGLLLLLTTKKQKRGRQFLDFEQFWDSQGPTLKSAKPLVL